MSSGPRRVILRAVCRLFGFRSVIPSQVHRSLMDADNALGVQSEKHCDGWGVAYYVDGSPHILRSPTSAITDQLFHRVSGVVASETVLAHVRLATVGELNVLNCHPFQHGRWTMAHNGEVRRYPEFADTLKQSIAPRLRRFVLGDTDSEVLFYLFLTHLQAYGPLSGRLGLDAIVPALRETIELVREKCDGDEEALRALLTIIVTDGTCMAAHQGGKELFWSSYKNRCADRDECPSLAPECEAPTTTGFVNHLIFTSEPLQGENVWIPMEEGEIVAVDWRMRLHRSTDDKRRLSILAS